MFSGVENNLIWVIKPIRQYFQPIDFFSQPQRGNSLRYPKQGLEGPLSTSHLPGFELTPCIPSGIEHANQWTGIANPAACTSILATSSTAVL